MRKIYLLLVCCLWCFPLLAQYETVVFNYDRMYFNEGQPLPAETKFILTGTVGRRISMVEVSIYDSPDDDEAALYTNAWKKGPGSTENMFVIPVNYPLRGSGEYTLLINYYQAASGRQQRELFRQLNSALHAYIDQSYVVSRNSIELRKLPRNIRNDLNAIVNQGLSLYKSQIGHEFNGFSDIVLEKLDQINDLRLRKARRNIVVAEGESNAEVRLKYANEQVHALKTLVSQEVAQHVNAQLHALTDSRKITDYESKKTRNVLAINVGYGGVYYSGGFDDFTSDTAPYAGISIPFGKAAFNSPFWTRSSISAGVFFKNLDFGGDNEATGPLVKRPVYMALGYRALPFIRIHGGAALLQSSRESTSISDFDIDRVYVRPFIGLSLELNLWLDFSR
jgi:hypothetical protein